jgi:hypothetical protein
MADVFVVLEFRDGEGRSQISQVITPELTFTVDIPLEARTLTLSTSVTKPPFTPVPSSPPGFNDHVLLWLREKEQLDAEHIESVTGYGTDWAGDTNGGFYSEQTITIEYRTGSGDRAILEVTGDRFISLWNWVIGVWTK